MPEIIITSMSIQKGTIEIKEVKLVDPNGMPTRTIALNEKFAVALRGTIIELNMDEEN